MLNFFLKVKKILSFLHKIADISIIHVNSGDLILFESEIAISMIVQEEISQAVKSVCGQSTVSLFLPEAKIQVIRSESLSDFKTPNQDILRTEQGLIQIRRCPKCGYFVYWDDMSKTRDICNWCR